jgi:hypothetical protein
MKALDPKSKIAEVVTTTRQFCRDNPTDWKKARLAIKQRWQTHGGIVRDRNGYELNTACVIAALIYGHNDFVETLRTAFNLGWDADCDGATAATVVGVMKGRRWMNDQGWDIKDVYRNTTRDDMPNGETLTGLENTLVEAARITIKRQGGELISTNGKRLYRIRAESPANIEPLATGPEQLTKLREHFAPQLQKDLATPGVTRARAAYITICLGEAERFKRESPKEWATAIAELQEKYPAVVHNAFKSPTPIGDPLRREAERAGLHDPKNIKLTERPLED